MYNHYHSVILDGEIDGPPGSYHHLVIVENHVGMHFYIDGEKDAVVAPRRYFYAHGAMQVTLGGRYDLHRARSLDWPGIVRDFAMWHRELSEPEIMVLDSCAYVSRTYSSGSPLRWSRWHIRRDRWKVSTSLDQTVFPFAHKHVS